MSFDAADEYCGFLELGELCEQGIVGGGKGDFFDDWCVVGEK